MGKYFCIFGHCHFHEVKFDQIYGSVSFYLIILRNFNFKIKSRTQPLFPKSEKILRLVLYVYSIFVPCDKVLVPNQIAVCGLYHRISLKEISMLK